MGLNVNVWKNVRVAENQDSDDFDFVADAADGMWDYRMINLEYGKHYTGDKCDCTVSYGWSSHFSFRKLLLTIAGRTDLILADGQINWEKLLDEKELSFYKFINFSDSMGCMDWETSAEIYEDFVKFSNYDFTVFPYFYGIYFDWLEVFKHGKEKGSVVEFS